MSRSRRGRDLIALSAVCALCAVLAVPTPAGAAGQRLPRVTTENISTGQPDLAPACQPDASSPEADLVERAPQLAVNPLDRDDLVAVWEQGNRNQAWDPAGALGDETVITAAATPDGGASWSQSVVPDLSCRSGAPAGIYDGPVAEPNLVFGPDGTLYLTTTAAARPLDPSAPTPASGVQLSVSHDAGATWAGPVHVDVGDRGVLAPDPTTAGTAYLAYDQPIGEPGDAVLVRRVTTTIDGTVALSAPAVVLPPGPGGAQALGQDIGVLADGTVVVAVLEATPPVVARVLIVVSHDHGATWSLPVEIATCDPDFPMDPDTGAPAVAGLNSPSVATFGNRAYVAWTSLEPDLLNQTNPRQDVGHVMVAATADAGTTWTQPVAVNPPTSQSHQVMEARIAAGADGIGVVYYDFRNDLVGDTVFTSDVWFEQSLDGGTTWREAHLAGPFDLRAVGPGAISNYIDLTDSADGFDAVYALGSPLTTRQAPVEGAVDIYRAHIG
jgi:hypothetical protein